MTSKTLDIIHKKRISYNCFFLNSSDTSCKKILTFANSFASGICSQPQEQNLLTLNSTTGGKLNLKITMLFLNLDMISPSVF